MGGDSREGVRVFWCFITEEKESVVCFRAIAPETVRESGPNRQLTYKITKGSNYKVRNVCPELRCELDK